MEVRPFPTSIPREMWVSRATWPHSRELSSSSVSYGLKCSRAQFHWGEIMFTSRKPECSQSKIDLYIPLSRQRMQLRHVTSACTQNALTSYRRAPSSSWINKRLQIHHKNWQIMLNYKYIWENCTALTDNSLKKRSWNWSNELFVTNYLPSASCDVRPWGGE